MAVKLGLKGMCVTEFRAVESSDKIRVVVAGSHDEYYCYDNARAAEERVGL